MALTLYRKSVLMVLCVALAFALLLALLLASSSVTYAIGSAHAPASAGNAQDTITDSIPLITTAGPFTTIMPLLFRRYPPPFAYSYSFDDPGCDGWTIHYFDTNEPDPPGAWTALCGKEKLNRRDYGSNGVYSVKTSAAWNTWTYTAPVVLADPRNFTIALEGKATQDFMWASSWGVYFNANADRTKFYSIQIYQTGVPDLGQPPQYAIRRWLNFRGTAVDDNDTLIFKKCWVCDNQDFEWNRVTIRRIGDWVYFHAGDAQYPDLYNQLLISMYLPEYTGPEYYGVGVLQGNFEFMNWNFDDPAFQIDNFYAAPVERR
jgi:hypothetical protein